MDLLELISTIPLFTSLSMMEKQHLADLDHIFVRYEVDEIILRENAPSTAFFIVITGSVRVTRKDLPGKSLALLRTGSIFGEMGYLTSEPRSTNVIANEDTVAMKLNNAILKKLNPETRDKIKDKLIEVLVRRIKQMNDLLVNRLR